MPGTGRANSWNLIQLFTHWGAGVGAMLGWSFSPSWAVACAQGHPLRSFSNLECPRQATQAQLGNPRPRHGPVSSSDAQKETADLSPEESWELGYSLPQKGCQRSHISHPQDAFPKSLWNLLPPGSFPIQTTTQTSPLPLTKHRAFADVALTPHSPPSQPSTIPTPTGLTCRPLRAQLPTGQAVSSYNESTAHHSFSSPRWVEP